MLSALSIRAPSILIMAVLNFWSDNSNIPAMSGSDLALFLKIVGVFCLVWFLPFGMPCNFFLRDR